MSFLEHVSNRQESRHYRLVAEVESLLKSSEKCLEKLKTLKQKTKSECQPNEFEELIAISRNFQSEAGLPRAKESQDCPKEVIVDWNAVTPPLWDEGVMEKYIEGVVGSYFSVNPNTQKIAEEKLVNPVQSTSTDEEPLSARWLAVVEATGEEPLIASTTPTFTASSSTTSRKPVLHVPKEPTKVIQLRKDLPSQRKISRVSHKSCLTTRSAPSALPTPRVHFQPNKRDALKVGHCLRFVGSHEDFSGQHPNIILDSAEETLFARRREKSNEDSGKNLKSPRGKQISGKGLKKSSVKQPPTDKTWHEVLDQEHRMAIAEDSPGANLTIDSNTTNQNDNKSPENLNTPSSQLTQDPPRPKEVIYDSPTIRKETPKLGEYRKYNVQNLPVLCIRGECRVQKVIGISIDQPTPITADIEPQDNINKAVKHSAGEGIGQEQVENVKYVEYVYRHTKRKKDDYMTPAGVPSVDGNRCRQEGKQSRKRTSASIAISNDSRIGKESTKGCNREVTPREEILEATEEEERAKDSKRLNRFIAPFRMQEDSKQTEIISQTQPPDEIHYNSSFEGTETTSRRSTSELSSLTDDEKWISESQKHKIGSQDTHSSTSKRQLKETTRASAASPARYSSNDFDPSSDSRDESLEDVSNCFKDKFSPQVDQRNDILGILEEVFSPSDPEDREENVIERSPRKTIKIISPKVSPKVNKRIAFKETSVQTENFAPLSPETQEVQRDNQTGLATEVFQKIREDIPNHLKTFKSSKRTPICESPVIDEQIVETIIKPSENNGKSNVLLTNDTFRVEDHVYPLSNPAAIKSVPIENQAHLINSNISKDGDVCAGMEEIVKSYPDEGNRYITPESFNASDVIISARNDDSDYRGVRLSDNRFAVERNKMDGRQQIIAGEEHKYCHCSRQNWCHVNATQPEGCNFQNYFKNWEIPQSDLKRPRWSLFSTISTPSIFSNLDDFERDIDCDLFSTSKDDFSSQTHLDTFDRMEDNRWTRKETPRTSLENNPNFLKTLSKLTSNSKHRRFPARRKDDPEVQRAAKKFLRSLNNGSQPNTGRSGRTKKHFYASDSDVYATNPEKFPSISDDSDLEDWESFAKKNFVTGKPSKVFEFSDTSVFNTPAEEIVSPVAIPMSAKERKLQTPRTTTVSKNLIDIDISKLKLLDSGTRRNSNLYSTSSSSSLQSLDSIVEKRYSEKLEDLSEGEVLSIGEIKFLSDDSGF